MNFATFLVLHTVLLPLAHYTTGEQWTLIDQLSITTASDTQISPDGRFVAVVITELASASLADEGRMDQQRPPQMKQDSAFFIQRLLLFDAYSGRDAEPSTSANSLFGLVTEFCDHTGDCQLPRWSAGGKRLTFTSKGGNDSGTTNIWYSNEDSPSQWTSPKPLFATTPRSVQYYDWSVDGHSVAYTVALSQEVSDTVREVDDDVLIDVINNQGTVEKFQLCVVEGVDRFLKDAPFAATPVCFDSIASSVGFPAWYISCWPHPSQFTWAQSGLVFTHTNNTLANDWPSLGVSVLNTATGHSTLLNEQMFQPVWSADGQLLVTAKLDLHFWVWSQVWALCVADKSFVAALHCDSSGSFDQEPEIIGFTGDNRFILYTEQKGMLVLLYAAEVLHNSTGMPKWQIGPHHEVSIQGAPTGVISNVAIATSGVRTFMTFVAENSTAPPEVYAAELTIDTVGLPIADAKQLSHLNENAVHQFNFSHSTIRWKSQDSTEVEGILLQQSAAASRNEASPRPLVVFFHPGPNLAHTNTYLGFGGVGARYPVATMAEHGISVLMPNIRGSSGYGAQWRASIFQDWGGKDLEDAMYGVQHLVEQGTVDAKRVAVIGWSYGGYMTSMALTKCEKEYNMSLAAAAVGGGIVDLISHTGTADISAILSNTFGGYYWQTDELVDLYEDRSAMYSIAKAKAPTLIQHGAHDPRVPILQAFQLHFALKAHGVPTRMLVYPNSGHIPSVAGQLFNIWTEVLAWIERYI